MDEQAKDLEQRFITRHGFHGTWNYTISPVPRAPAPPPVPAPPPGPDLDALADPAITGISRDDLAALTAALTIPWQPPASSGSTWPAAAPAARTPAPPPPSSSAWTPTSSPPSAATASA